MPPYQLSPLLKYMPAIEAAELRQAVTAAAAPHTKRTAYQSFMRQLASLARALDPEMAPSPPIEHVEIDRAKAAEWFRQQGVRVVPSDDTVEAA